MTTVKHPTIDHNAAADAGAEDDAKDGGKAPRAT